MKKNHLNLGNITITWLCGGHFELDGGTMYGAVPKILWQERYPADTENYIKILNAPLLIQTDSHNLIIDTGLGNKLTEKQLRIFRVYQPWSLPEDLHKIGLEPDDIDYVLLTHGDFDHAGGVVMTDSRGHQRITFPRAKHILHEIEWHDINHQNSRSRHSYFSENFTGLTVGDNLVLNRVDEEIVPGVTMRLTGGHTRGHQLVEINGSEGCAVHLGDVLPTHTHTNPLWIMAYDNFPLDLIALKETLLPHYRKNNCWFTFYHDIYMKACRIDKEGKPAQHIP